MCPKCNKEYKERPAISRYSGEKICPRCGTREAIDYMTKEEQDKIIALAYGSI